MISIDEVVTKYYRRLLRLDFEYPGELENPSILLDSVGKKSRFTVRPATIIYTFTSISGTAW
jgi:hypothetical protein